MTKRVLALGFFDGVHLGHGALIRKTAERAAELGAVPAVLTFDVHPDTLVHLAGGPGGADPPPLWGGGDPFPPL